MLFPAHDSAEIARICLLFLSLPDSERPEVLTDGDDHLEDVYDALEALSFGEPVQLVGRRLYLLADSVAAVVEIPSALR